MLWAMYDLRWVLATFAGSWAACLSFVLLLDRMVCTGPEPALVRDRPSIADTPYFQTLVSDSQYYRGENFRLRCEVERARTERDELRRALMRGPLVPHEGELPPGDMIPATTLPTNPEGK